MGDLNVLQGVRTVQLTQGLNALIDESDFDAVSSRKWGALKSDRERCVYVRHGSSKAGKYVNTLLHRFLMGEPASRVDHRNGDGRDNRRCNLRTCTTLQNAGNARAVRARSGFKGVHLQAPGRPKPWVARIRHAGRNMSLGMHATAEEAARAYDAKARELFGEFACTNVDIFGEVV